jgi:TPR repeat protein
MNFQNYYDRALNGDADFQNILGFCYQYGITFKSCKLDIKQAMIWYKKAAEQGHLQAQYNLGWCYQYSKSIDKRDMNKAIHW